MLLEIASLVFLSVVASSQAGQPLPEEGSCGPCQTSLLENVNDSLTAMRNENKQAINDLRQELGQELNNLNKKLKSQTKIQDKLRQESKSQNDEMMNVTRQILEAFGKKEEPELVGGPRDCADHFKAGNRTNGIYRIKADGLEAAFDVYCDMEREGGGWTVIQRRGDFGSPKDLFQKSWADYKTGFGQMDKDFWLGNEKISALSSQGPYELLVDMWNYQERNLLANYKLFRVENEDHYYTLHVGKFSGNTYDCLKFNNGMRFATFDRDTNTSCVERGECPFWHRNDRYLCTMTCLNGIRDEENVYEDAFSWSVLDGTLGLSSAVMMIKALSFLD